jgi:hypothetical protein
MDKLLKYFEYLLLSLETCYSVQMFKINRIRKVFKILILKYTSMLVFNPDNFFEQPAPVGFLIYSEIINIRGVLNFMDFVGRSIREF